MKYYLGMDENNRWSIFTADKQKDATPEATGYVATTYGMDTYEEAEELCNRLNKRF